MLGVCDCGRPLPSGLPVCRVCEFTRSVKFPVRFFPDDELTLKESVRSVNEVVIKAIRWFLRQCREAKRLRRKPFKWSLKDGKSRVGADVFPLDVPVKLWEEFTSFSAELYKKFTEIQVLRLVVAQFLRS